MALSSGTKSLFGEVLGWIFVAGIGAAALMNYAELRSFSAEMMGLPAPEEKAASEQQPAAAAEVSRDGTVEIRANDNGHFHADAEINGRSVEVMVDTGATLVALSYEDAEAAGIYLKSSDFTQGVSTANGIARVAPVILDRVSIGDITVRNVAAAVAEPGRLKTSLLGMSFLSKLDRFDMRSGVLVLQN